MFKKSRFEPKSRRKHSPGDKFGVCNMKQPVRLAIGTKCKPALPPVPTRFSNRLWTSIIAAPTPWSWAGDTCVVNDALGTD